MSFLSSILPYYSPQGLNVRFEYDPRRNYDLLLTQQPSDHFVLTRIPMAVAGLPPNTLLRGTAEVRIDVGGKPWPEAGTIFNGNVAGTNSQYWQELNLRKDFASTLLGKMVNLHATFRLDIVNDRAEDAIQIRDSWFAVPNIGRCHLVHVLTNDFLTCRTGLKESVETSVFLNSPRAQMSLLGDVPSSPVPWLLSPSSAQTLSIDLSQREAGSTIIVIPRWRVAEFQRSIEANGIDLTKYMPPLELLHK